MKLPGQIPDRSAHFGDHVIAPAPDVSDGADNLEHLAGILNCSNPHVGAAQVNADGKGWHVCFDSASHEGDA